MQGLILLGSDIRAIQAELATHIRPLDKIYTMTLAKWDAVPSDNPLSRAVEQPEAVITAMTKALKTAISDKKWLSHPTHVLTHCLKNVTASKPMMNSHFTWSVLNKKNPTRDMFRPALASALEYYALDEYRRLPQNPSKPLSFQHFSGNCGRG